MNPFYVKKKGEEDTPVPCGKCPKCCSRRASAWSFRLIQQDKVSTSSFFVTLTYDQEHVRLTRNKFLTLDKTDLQNYFKRLRKLNKHAKLKYYAVGEYGSKGRRPHYHIILFNACEKTIAMAWALNNIPFGQVDIGTVSGASIGYTLKYISKPRTIPLHRNDDRLPEFSLMSKEWGHLI